MGDFNRYFAYIFHCAGFLNSRILRPDVTKQLPHQLNPHPVESHNTSNNWDNPINTHLLAEQQDASSFGMRDLWNLWEDMTVTVLAQNSTGSCGSN
ncbi:hypothetical protein Trydic_g13016 [Trypoxylus dichotomus]